MMNAAAANGVLASIADNERERLRIINLDSSSKVDSAPYSAVVIWLNS